MHQSVFQTLAAVAMVIGAWVLTGTFWGSVTVVLANAAANIGVFVVFTILVMCGMAATVKISPSDITKDPKAARAMIWKRFDQTVARVKVFTFLAQLAVTTFLITQFANPDYAQPLASANALWMGVIFLINESVWGVFSRKKGAA